MRFSSLRGSTRIAWPVEVRGRSGDTPSVAVPSKNLSPSYSCGLFVGPPPYTESRSNANVRPLTRVVGSTGASGCGNVSSVRSWSMNWPKNVMPPVVPLGFAMASCLQHPLREQPEAPHWSADSAVRDRRTSARNWTAPPHPPACVPWPASPTWPASRPGPAGCWRRTDSGPQMPEPLTRRRIRGSAVPGHQAPLQALASPEHSPGPKRCWPLTPPLLLSW